MNILSKILKTIIILNLVIGITVPTNAAVSVSDGSAFVTKAEFSADLNNLSNRMAQLENSLDAKIDSLVSSYLTRNGIWNGAKQELNFSSWYLQDSIDLPGKNAGGSYNTFLAREYRIVNSISKTGLCEIVMSQASTSNKAIFGMWQKTGSFARVWDSTFALFGYFTTSSTKNNTIAKLAYAIGTGYGKAFYDGSYGNASQSLGVFTQTTEVVQTYYFFISKGDFLNTYFHTAYFVPTGTSFGYAGQKINFNIKTITVY